jgi:opacity protein-like surface antigen
VERRLIPKILVVISLLTSLSVVASAQLPTSGNVFLGYSYSGGQTFGPFGTHGNNMNGWDATLEGKFLPWIGVVADFDWHYGGNDLFGCVTPACMPAKFRLNASRHAVLFGPRASVSFGRYTPFAEFLLGIAHQTDTGGGISNSDTGFSRAVGGGLDYKLVKGVAWRVEGDSVHTNLFGVSNNNLRISTGVVFHF